MKHETKIDIIVSHNSIFAESDKFSTNLLII